MKHLRLFENRGDEFYIVVYEYLEDASGNYVALFDDAKSAENYYIEVINDLKKDKFIRKKKNWNDGDIITSVQEAEDFLDDNWEYKVHTELIRNKGKYELPEEIQRARDAKKYNL